MQIQNLNSPRKSAHKENKGYLRSTSRKIFKEKEILKLRYILKKKVQKCCYISGSSYKRKKKCTKMGKKLWLSLP